MIKGFNKGAGGLMLFGALANLVFWLGLIGGSLWLFRYFGII